MASPKTRLKTKAAAEAATTAALAAAGATRWVSFEVTETVEERYRQERRGRPGNDTRYRRADKHLFALTAAVRAETVSFDAVTDGCFPFHAARRVMPHLIKACWWEAVNGRSCSA